MNCWEILELEPTSDKKKVKQAYAAKLKTINVDDEPLAFQTLKEAFDSAIFLSGTIIESNRPIKDSNISVENSDFTTEKQMIELKEDVVNHPSDEKQDIFIGKEVELIDENYTEALEPIKAVEQFKQELLTIYEKMDFFSDIESWRPLFLNELEWTIDEHSEITEVMQEFLLANYRVLSRKVIDYLDSFFDFDSLANDFKSGNYFCYTWTEIKHVPPFTFDIYQEIPKEQRIEYFTNRFELFQLVNSGVPNQNSWYERLDLCRSVTTSDVEVVILEISYLLLNDFRMEKGQTVITLKKRLSEARELKETNASDFFSAYYEWATQNGAANDVLIFDKSELNIPPTIVDLLMGYVYFTLRRHSRVKECWDDLRKKNHSLFRPEELAMLQLVEPIRVPSKKKKSGGQYVWMIFVLIFAIVKIGGAISKNSEKNSYVPTINRQNLFSGEHDSQTSKLVNKLLDLKESENLYDQFIYYFYVDREDDDRASFIEANLVGQAKDMAQQLTIAELPEIQIDNRYDFYSSPDNVANYGPVTALTLLDEEEPFIILQEDKEENIANIFGASWEVLPKDKFDALWADIQVRPMMSQKFFVVYYLLSDERNENLKDNPEYVTDNVKKMLDKNSSMPIAEEFESGTWQISQDEEDKLYTIINDEKDEHRFILSYDDYGRLEHVYGENWEKIDEVKKQQIYDNAEEKVGVY
ncbi:hypothetical protein A5821_000319 [Enterococcus sp. 7F3_DIV0205]|uniref:J domain-containing protein n=1 Tax=Candidatus Enterococcus palustris TaxID=1834189 RepID=A0AAQ3W9J8_9ENTE|nr:hypothetical protein [Enterococcus sp. 7F3_DIV0205]OTN84732.1 hypothetical protein A5821_000661 [Enterococcus sp. 7F3_DIV0205]